MRCRSPEIGLLAIEDSVGDKMPSYEERSGTTDRFQSIIRRRGEFKHIGLFRRACAFYLALFTNGDSKEDFFGNTAVG